jgi:hypothetical protein
LEAGNAVGRWRVRYPISAEAHVSIIIASGGKADVLKANLEGLFTKTRYRDFEVVVNTSITAINRSTTRRSTTKLPGIVNRRSCCS